MVEESLPYVLLDEFVGYMRREKGYSPGAVYRFLEDSGVDTEEEELLSIDLAVVTQMLFEGRDPEDESEEWPELPIPYKFVNGDDLSTNDYFFTHERDRRLLPEGGVQDLDLRRGAYLSRRNLAQVLDCEISEVKTIAGEFDLDKMTHRRKPFYFVDGEVLRQLRGGVHDQKRGKLSGGDSERVGEICKELGEIATSLSSLDVDELRPSFFERNEFLSCNGQESLHSASSEVEDVSLEEGVESTVYGTRVSWRPSGELLGTFVENPSKAVYLTSTGKVREIPPEGVDDLDLVDGVHLDIEVISSLIKWNPFFSEEAKSLLEEIKLSHEGQAFYYVNDYTLVRLEEIKSALGYNKKGA